MIVNDKCTVCGERHFYPSRIHVCPPRWEVCDESCQDEEGWEWDPLFARDPAQAAERFCERWDRRDGEYPYVNAEQSEILVRGSDGIVHKMSVEARMEPTYSASPCL